MKPETVERLRADGWKVGSAASFLQLSDEERRLVDLKLSLSCAVRHSRAKRKLSQSDLAGRMKSSQSRIAKIEAGDASVSLDLMFRTALCLGASLREVGRAISRAGHLPNRSRKAS